MQLSEQALRELARNESDLEIIPMTWCCSVRVIAKKMNGKGYEEVLASGMEIVGRVLSRHGFCITSSTPLINRVSRCTQEIWVHYAPATQQLRRKSGVVKDLSSGTHFPY